jgi:hypothetical protein
MSLRGAYAATKQSPARRGDCFATCARNDMLAKVTADNNVLQPRVRRSRMVLESSNVKYRHQEIAAI